MVPAFFVRSAHHSSSRNTLKNLRVFISRENPTARLPCTSNSHLLPCWAPLSGSRRWHLISEEEGKIYP